MGPFRLLDLECVLDPDMGPPVKANGEPYAFTPAPWWQVVCAASIVIDSEDGEWIVTGSTLCGTDEARILSMVTRAQLKDEATIVTFGGRHYDLPVITARAMRHAIDWRWYWNCRGARYRFDTVGTIDMADELTDYGAADKTGLDAWSKLVGGPSKLAHVFARWVRVKGKLTAKGFV